MFGIIFLSLFWFLFTFNVSGDHCDIAVHFEMFNERRGSKVDPFLFRHKRNVSDESWIRLANFGNCCMHLLYLRYLNTAQGSIFYCQISDVHNWMTYLMFQCLFSFILHSNLSRAIALTHTNTARYKGCDTISGWWRETGEPCSNPWRVLSIQFITNNLGKIMYPSFSFH